MTDSQYTNQTTDLRSDDSPPPGNHTAASTCRSGMLGCGMGKKGMKGLLLMAACCGAPLLLFLALPFMGSALGAFGASALNTLALLACPIGMALMMWMMMRGQRADIPQQTQTQPAAASQMTSMAPAVSQETALREPVPASEATTVTSSAPPQADLVTPRQQVNGHQTQRPVLDSNGSQAAGPGTDQRSGALPHA